MTKEYVPRKSFKPQKPGPVLTAHELKAMVDIEAMVASPVREKYEIIATSNGHKWMLFRGITCCRDCGTVRRADDNNALCKGLRSRVELR